MIPAAIVAVLIALVAWSLARRWRRGVAACIAAPLAIVVAELVLKPLVDRGYPGSGHLYPSGHLTALGATATLVLVVGGRLLGRRAWLVLCVACVLACAGAVVAAVASHAHGPVDTVAGLPTGASVTLAWVLAVDALADFAGRADATGGGDSGVIASATPSPSALATPGEASSRSTR